MEIEIKDYGYRSMCDVRRCSERAVWSIGVPGESKLFYHNFCEKHLKEIIVKGFAILSAKHGEEYKKEVEHLINFDAIEPIEETKIAQKEEEYNAKIEELSAELATSKATIELLKEKIAVLNKKLANKPKKK